MFAQPFLNADGRAVPAKQERGIKWLVQSRVFNTDRKQPSLSHRPGFCFLHLPHTDTDTRTRTHTLSLCSASCPFAVLRFSSNASITHLCVSTLAFFCSGRHTRASLPARLLCCHSKVCVLRARTCVCRQSALGITAPLPTNLFMFVFADQMTLQQRSTCTDIVQVCV